jgi:hypothetical protein
VFAGEKKNQDAPVATPAVPMLTDAQRASIAMALYDSVQLNGAREAIAKAEDNLRKALGACGSGFVVTRDPADQQLKCVVVPPQPVAAPSPAKPSPETPSTK